MREVDARGLSCPEPLMLTAEALKKGNDPVRVLVTEPHQKMNVEKFAKDHGRKTHVYGDRRRFCRGDRVGQDEKERVKACRDISYNSRCHGDEKVCGEKKVPGRLIPVPRSISAGCGLSWCAPLDAREHILEVMKETSIEEEALHECMV